MPSNNGLWQRIQAFEIDGADTELSFSARLARENGWSRERALAAIEEYRKFVYLLCVAETPLTPAEPVDQVWHLHLLYTRSYWMRLCGEVLGRTLHHEPTTGGAAQGCLFDAQYARTLSLYEGEFGVSPPAEYWPRRRSVEQPNHRWIDARACWIVPKRLVRGGAQGGLLLGLAGLLASCGNDHSDAEGGISLGTLLAIAIPVGIVWLAHRLSRRAGTQDSQSSIHYGMCSGSGASCGGGGGGDGGCGGGGCGGGCGG